MPPARPPGMWGGVSNTIPLAGVSVGRGFDPLDRDHVAGHVGRLDPIGVIRKGGRVRVQISGDRVRPPRDAIGSIAEPSLQ